MVAGALTLLMLPSFFSLRRRWSADICHAMPISAWRRLVEIWPQPSGGGFRYATITGSWGVYAVWPLAAVVIALVVVRRRDV
jgi:ABC-2 type transport system permease protein